MKQSRYPVGWDEERVRRVLEYYEAQSDEEAVAEDEATYEATPHTMMEVPVELVPLVREVIATRSAERIAGGALFCQPRGLLINVEGHDDGNRGLRDFPMRTRRTRLSRHAQNEGR